jgi:hypothetical protein
LDGYNTKLENHLTPTKENHLTPGGCPIKAVLKIIYSLNQNFLKTKSPLIPL